MPRIPPALARTSHKAIRLMNRPSSSSSNSNKTSRTPSTNELILRFSDAVKRFFKLLHSPLPRPTAPRRPHPFHYNTLMKSFSQTGDVDHVLQLFDEMKASNCAPDVVCYTTVIDTLVTAGRPEAAVAVFKEMVSTQLVPDAAAYTILVKLYACYLQQFDSAYEVVRWMVKCGCRPDVVTYSTLVAGLCRAGRVEEAMGVLDQMLEEGCRPNIHTFTPLIQAYCFHGRIEEAKRLLNTMENIGCPPNTVTYNILIEALCRIGLFDEVDKHLMECRVKGWEPDTISYSIYMDGLCKRGRADKAFEQLEIMLANGVYPNAVTLNILLDGLCRSSKAWEAKCLLERSGELEWDVNIVNYNTVMSRLCEAGRWLAVLKLFTDAIKRGIGTNTWTVSILVHSLCRAGKAHMAMCILNSKGPVPNVVTYTTLIHYLRLARKFDEIHLLFCKMQAENVAPNLVTYNIMIDCLCREGKLLEAIDCFHRSLEVGYSPHLVARLTYGLVRGAKFREVLNLFEQILKQGFVIDFCIFDSLIKAYCRMGYCRSTEIFIVCHILDKMLGIR